ncbi:MAG: hypothetical protein ACI8RD_007697, partial [Bacillariaceae sp.]
CNFPGLVTRYSTYCSNATKSRNRDIFSMVRTNCFLISSTFDIVHRTSYIVPKNAPAPNAAISTGTRPDIVFILNTVYIKVYLVQVHGFRCVLFSVVSFLFVFVFPLALEQLTANREGNVLFIFSVNNYCDQSR